MAFGTKRLPLCIREEVLPQNAPTGLKRNYLTCLMLPVQGKNARFCIQENTFSLGCLTAPRHPIRGLQGVMWPPPNLNFHKCQKRKHCRSHKDQNRVKYTHALSQLHSQALTCLGFPRQPASPDTNLFGLIDSKNTCRGKKPLKHQILDLVIKDYLKLKKQKKTKQSRDEMNRFSFFSWTVLFFFWGGSRVFGLCLWGNLMDVEKQRRRK